jgi:hypothetical protein
MRAVLTCSGSTTPSVKRGSIAIIENDRHKAWVKSDDSNRSMNWRWRDAEGIRYRGPG